MIRRIAVLAATAALALAAFAQPAQAAVACNSGEFCLYPSVNYGGTPAKWGGSWSGCWSLSGTSINNNAESAINKMSKTVYLFGNTDCSALEVTMAAGSSRSTLSGYNNQPSSVRFG